MIRIPNDDLADNMIRIPNGNFVEHFALSLNGFVVNLVVQFHNGNLLDDLAESLNRLLVDLVSQFPISDLAGDSDNELVEALAQIRNFIAEELEQIRLNQLLYRERVYNALESFVNEVRNNPNVNTRDDIIRCLADALNPIISNNIELFTKISINIFDDRININVLMDADPGLLTEYY